MMKRKKMNGSKEDTTRKKIINNIKTLAALLIASATFVACSGDDNITEEQPVQPVQPQVYTMTVDASKGGDAADSRTTRALSLSGSTLSATWATTENVYVKMGDTWASGSLQPQADGTTATLKGTLSGITISADDNLTLQFPKSGDITYAGQTGTLDDIAANFDYATASVEVESISASGNINPKAATTEFTNRQAIIKFTLQNSDGSALPGNPTAFTVSDGTSTVALTSIPAATYTTNGNGVLYVAFPAAGESKTVTLTATVGSGIYTYEKTGVTFTNGKFYRVTVKMTKVQGVLSGQFSVGSGTKVYFSKGNLQYTKSTGKWSFMTNQYSTVETLNQSVGTNYASQNVVSLFGWGTSGSAPSGQTARDSYYTNANNDDYVSNITTTGVSWGTGSEWDWGTAAASDLGSGWRTLTKDEWVYLFNTRTVNNGQGSGKSYTLGQTVNDVLGVVLYPDDYTGSTYSGSDWSTFEDAGCVFLPAAGYRSGPYVYDVGSLGDYWSSTASSASNAYYVRVMSGTVNPANNSSRSRGYSVRLVRPVE